MPSAHFISPLSSNSHARAVTANIGRGAFDEQLPAVNAYLDVIHCDPSLAGGKGQFLTASSIARLNDCSPLGRRLISALVALLNLAANFR